MNRALGYRFVQGMTAGAAFVGMVAGGEIVQGQVSVQDSTRSLTEAVLYSDGTVTQGPFSSPRDSNTIGGAYSNSYAESASSLAVSNNIPASLDTAVVNYNCSSSQNSQVSSGNLSASGSTVAGAGITPILGQWAMKDYSESLYDVDFTVATPTPFTLTGAINATTAYHVGLLELVTGSITLTGSASASPLYSVSFQDPQYGFAGLSIDDPASYSTTLEPGQTYTLYAEASSNSNKIGSGEASYSTATAGFSFSSSVPEPASCLLITASMVFLSRRKKRAFESQAGKPLAV